MSFTYCREKSTDIQKNSAVWPKPNTLKVHGMQKWFKMMKMSILCVPFELNLSGCCKRFVLTLNGLVCFSLNVFTNYAERAD